MLLYDMRCMNVMLCMYLCVYAIYICMRALIRKVVCVCMLSKYVMYVCVLRSVCMRVMLVTLRMSVC